MTDTIGGAAVPMVLAETQTEMKTGSGALAELVRGLAIRSNDDFELMAEYRAAAIERLGVVEEKIGKPTKTLYDTWRQFKNLENELAAPWKAIVDGAGKAMGDYTLAEQKRARELEEAQRRENARLEEERKREAARLQKAAEDRARASQEAAAADAAALGDRETAEALRAAPVVVEEVIQPPPPPPPPPAAIAKPSAAGTSVPLPWKGRGVNIAQLVVAAAAEIAKDGSSPLLGLIQWNEPALNAKATAEKQFFKVPGAEAYQAASVRQKRR